MTRLNVYEISFLNFYRKKYDAEYIKVKHNNGEIPTEVVLYSAKQYALKHSPTYEGVTVEGMFGDLKQNVLYQIDGLIENIKRR